MKKQVIILYHLFFLINGQNVTLTNSLRIQNGKNGTLSLRNQGSILNINKLYLYKLVKTKNIHKLSSTLESVVIISAHNNDIIELECDFGSLEFDNCTFDFSKSNSTKSLIVLSEKIGLETLHVNVTDIHVDSRIQGIRTSSFHSLIKTFVFLKYYTQPHYTILTLSLAGFTFLRGPFPFILKFG